MNPVPADPHERHREQPGKRRSARLGALAALPFVLALAVCLGTFAVLRDRLPDPVATHFDGLDGAADGFTAQGTFGLVAALLLGCTGLLFCALCAAAGDQAGWALPVGYGTAGLIGSAMVSTVLVNRDADDAASVHLPLWHLAIALGVGVVLALLGRQSVANLPFPGTPGRPRADRSELSAELSAELAGGHAAGWVRGTGSRVLAGLAAAALLAAVATALFTRGWSLPVSLCLVGLLMLGSARLQVSVGARGLVVASAVLPWPRIRVPLDSMNGAASRDIGALRDFGGWGYRIRPGASGVILRSGEALVVRRSSGREFAVTVDDAATAAALLNSLIDRRKKR